MLNPDQAARIAGIAKWQEYQLKAHTYGTETDDLETVLYCEDGTVTLAGFFDLLRVCEDNGIEWSILSDGGVFMNHHMTTFLKIADLPTALALAILKALEDK